MTGQRRRLGHQQECRLLLQGGHGCETPDGRGLRGSQLQAILDGIGAWNIVAALCRGNGG